MEKLKLDIPKLIQKLEIATKDLVSSGVMGSYKSVFRGKGLEFDSYRDYYKDEDSKDIDWKASLRAGELLVKQYTEERDLEVFFLVDVGSSMVYGTADKLKSEYAAEVVASLSYIILKSDDHIGMALFSDRVVTKLPISKDKRQFYALSKDLVNPYLYGGGYNLENALKFLLSYLKRRVVVIIVSDFIGLKGDWKKYLKIASSKFDVIGIMIRDPADRDLPDNKHPVMLSNPFSGEQILVVSNELKSAYDSFVRRSETEIKKAFLSSGGDFVRLVTDKPFAGYLVSFFKERRRRLGYR